MFLTLLVVVLYNLVMANNNKRSFYVNGELLRKIISIKGLTQADVYKAVNIGENTIYRVIKFNRMESYNDFDRICQYLDIDPELLLEKECHLITTVTFNNHEKINDVIINVDNIEDYIDRCTYKKSDGELFDKTYIYQFMKNSPSSDSIPNEVKLYLFKKIVETRDIFAGYFDAYVMKVALSKNKKSKNKTVNIDINDFYKAFDLWFDENIKNKHL